MRRLEGLLVFLHHNAARFLVVQDVRDGAVAGKKFGATGEELPAAGGEDLCATGEELPGACGEQELV